MKENKKDDCSQPCGVRDGWDALSWGHENDPRTYFLIDLVSYLSICAGCWTILMGWCRNQSGISVHTPPCDKVHVYSRPCSDIRHQTRVGQCTTASLGLTDVLCAGDVNLRAPRILLCVNQDFG